MQFYNARYYDGHLYQFNIQNQKITQWQRWDQQSKSGTDLKGHWILPGMVDMHTHARDPGLTHKEDWQSMSRAAAKGGVVAVADMPNTIPPMMDAASIETKRQASAAASIGHRHYLGVCAANISQLGQLLEDHGDFLCGLKVYYGQSTGELMFADLEALHAALPQPFPGLLVFHSEDQCGIDRNAKKLQPDQCPTPETFAIHSQIRDSDSAYASTKVILDWGKRHNRPLHIAHLSTPAELELIEAARSQGQQVTTEVAPHHLLFSQDDYPRLGSLIKMNPPVRSEAERQQLMAGFRSGAIEAFATDHAPHTLEEKRQTTYAKCPSGVPSVEYFTPLLLTIAKQQGISLDQAVALGSQNPAQLCGFKGFGHLADNAPAHFVVVSETPHKIGPPHASKCGWSPFDGMSLDYRVEQTWYAGQALYLRED